MFVWLDLSDFSLCFFSLKKKKDIFLENDAVFLAIGPEIELQTSQTDAELCRFKHLHMYSAVIDVKWEEAQIMAVEVSLFQSLLLQFLGGISRRGGLSPD